jgi:hypothetical protein
MHYKSTLSCLVIVFLSTHVTAFAITDGQADQQTDMDHLMPLYEIWILDWVCSNPRYQVEIESSRMDCIRRVRNVLPESIAIPRLYGGLYAVLKKPLQRVASCKGSTLMRSRVFWPKRSIRGEVVITVSLLFLQPGAGNSSPPSGPLLYTVSNVQGEWKSRREAIAAMKGVSAATAGLQFNNKETNADTGLVTEYWGPTVSEVGASHIACRYIVRFARASTHLNPV